MAEILKGVVSKLVAHPTDVAVKREELPHGVLLTVTVNADDLPKLLGDEGQTMRSLQALVTAFGKRLSLNYILNIKSKSS